MICIAMDFHKKKKGFMIPHPPLRPSFQVLENINIYVHHCISYIKATAMGIERINKFL